MSSVQAVIFNNKKFNVNTARKWLSEHNIVPIKNVDKTIHYLRYRIKPPEQFNSFGIKEIAPGIKFVIGY